MPCGDRRIWKREQEIVSIVSSRREITTGPLGWIGGLDLGAMGFVIVGLFVTTWLVAVLVWRFSGVQNRWEARLVAEPISGD
ncbi:hypothetical protein [Rhodococcus sp. NPDC127528]|uniref:hypothetical protein n=1 Tax=unclassified Rhodococcus (in: high G+C Gram-positive bacteria) TaxID=192944 RepID=UPI0036412E79